MARITHEPSLLASGDLLAEEPASTEDATEVAHEREQADLEARRHPSRSRTISSGSAPSCYTQGHAPQHVWRFPVKINAPARG